MPLLVTDGSLEGGGWFPALMNHFQNLREPPDRGEGNFAEPFRMFVHLMGGWALEVEPETMTKS